MNAASENNNEVEILQYSYWEHFKFAKDLALVLPIDHPKRKKVEDELNNLQKKLQELKDKNKK